jgi:dTDP-4-amino-4,6-dideoxygalactose transaminase
MNVERSQRLFISPPHIGGEELDLIREAFASNYIAPIGPLVHAFEKEFATYVGIPHCLAVASGTAAMHLALRELGVGPGNEVLASTLTFIGSVSPATYLGATIAFIDSDAKSWNMDAGLLEEELAACANRGKLPKVVIPTDLYGQCADLPAIQAICVPYEIPVISDAAEAMGSRYYCKSESTPLSTLHPPSSAPCPSRLPLASSQFAHRGSLTRHAGYGAKAAIFSFNGNKIMTTSGGGMLASTDQALIEHARKLSQQGRDSAPHYEHTEIGYNYRLSNVLAAIGLGQLRVLDQRVERKRQIFDTYQQLLGGMPGLSVMPESPPARGNRWLTVIQIESNVFGATPEQVRLALEAENIESRPVWKPMHLQPVFRGCRVRGGEVSERLFRAGLCLPSGTAMTDADIERVVHIIRRCHSAGH